MDVSDSQTILSPGDMLGCYRIDSFLGQGGFGVTYIARDTMLDIQVAIKEYLPERIAQRVANSVVQPRSKLDVDVFGRGLDNFLKEARTLARFNHPNIVRVKSVFELNGTAYMVMEYERGHDLKVLFNRRENIGESVLKRMIGPVLNGLEEVHRHGFIHRDIKPANILVRDNGSPVLLDFGSARLAVGHSTEILTAMVTVGFAPLEQYSGLDDQQGPWTDIYALGAVLYYAMIGNAPPDSTLRGAAVLNEKADPYQPLSRLAPESYSRSFCEAVDWALQFKVSDRPQSLNLWRSRLFDDDFHTLPIATSGSAHSDGTETFTKTIPLRSRSNSPRSNSANELTVLNESPPSPDTSVRTNKGDRREDTYEVEPEPGRRFAAGDEPLVHAPLIHDDPEHGIFRQQKVPRQNYWLPGIVVTLSAAAIALATLQPWQTPASNDQAVNVQPASSERVEENVDQGIVNNNQPVADDSLVEQQQTAIVQDATVSGSISVSESDSETGNAPTSENAEQRAQAEQAARKAEADRLATARAARLEADRAVQRIEARRQAQLQEQREASVAAELERKAASLAAEKRAADVLDQARVNAADLASERSATRPVINASDMSDVLSRFDALTKALEQRDLIALKQITVPSDRKNAYFDYVFRTFDRVEVELSDISASTQDQTIRARLQVNRLIRDNGDVAIPPDEFRNIPIYTVKSATWSAIHW